MIGDSFGDWVEIAYDVQDPDDPHTPWRTFVRPDGCKLYIGVFVYSRATVPDYISGLHVKVIFRGSDGSMWSHESPHTGIPLELVDVVLEEIQSVVSKPPRSA